MEEHTESSHATNETKSKDGRISTIDYICLLRKICITFLAKKFRYLTSSYTLVSHHHYSYQYVINLYRVMID